MDRRRAAGTSDGAAADAVDGALLDLLTRLRQDGYRFVTPTPASHARILARADHQTAIDLRDVFGWSLPFAPNAIHSGLLDLLDAAGIVERIGDRMRSRLRVSSLGPHLYLHSAYPTEEEDAVFFGPDSYRFARLIAAELHRDEPLREGYRIVDIGTGAGVGAIVAGSICPSAQLVATDVNPAALRLARINARAAEVAIDLHLGDDLPPGDPFDLILSNPPYIIDSSARAYRDGGELHGGAVSLEIAEKALARLAPGGRFVLYTGSAIVADADALHERLVDLADRERCALRYEELDPDVFGEELANPAYRDVERIALIAAVFDRPGEMR